MRNQIISKDHNDITAKRKDSIEFIDKQFNVSKTVNHLHTLMHEVTREHVTADTVNAACNCVQNLNLTIKTAMQAAKFIANERLGDD